MKNPLIIGIGVVIAVLLVMAGVEYLFNIPPPEETSITTEQATPSREVKLPTEQKASSPQTEPTVIQSASTEERAPVTIGEQPSLNFEQKIEKLGEVIEGVSITGESRDVILVFTEAEANEQAVKLLSEIKIPEDIPLKVRGVSVDFQADNNVLTVVETTAFGFGFLPAKIKVKSKVDSEAGELIVEVTEVNFWFVRLPGSLKDRVAGFIGQLIGDLLERFTKTESSSKTTLEFDGINIQEERVTFRIRITPRT